MARSSSSSPPPHKKRRRLFSSLYETSSTSLNDISNLISSSHVENVEWLAGGLIRWLSRSICNSKSVRIYHHYHSQIIHESSFCSYTLQDTISIQNHSTQYYYYYRYCTNIFPRDRSRTKTSAYGNWSARSWSFCIVIVWSHRYPFKLDV